MGCDIHPHIEVKIAGKWHHYSIPRLRRNYALFAKIAGVRFNPNYPIAAISQPRGLPEDITDVTRFESVFDGGHSHTWLSKNELNEVIKWHEAQLERFPQGDGYKAMYEEWGYCCGNNFLEHAGSNPKEYEDVRLVCWFDN